MSAVLDRTPLHAQLDAADAAKKTAEQAINDALTALRLSGWGKITKLNWDGEYEHDDQGGMSFYCNSFQLTVGDEVVSLGYSVGEFDDFFQNLDEDDLDDPVNQLVQKYRLAGYTEDDKIAHAVIAELADLTEPELTAFFDLAQRLVEEDETSCEISFTA